MFPFQKQKSFCCPEISAKSSPIFSPALNMLVRSLLSHMCYRNLIPLIPQLLFSLQICFIVTIFVFELPSPPIWTSVLHLKLISLQTVLCNSPLWGTYHYLEWFSHGSFPWFSCRVSSLLWNDACSPLKRSGSHFGTCTCFLHYSKTKLADVIYPLKGSEEISQKQYRKEDNKSFVPRTKGLRLIQFKEIILGQREAKTQCVN